MGLGSPCPHLQWYKRTIHLPKLARRTSCSKTPLQETTHKEWGSSEFEFIKLSGEQQHLETESFVQPMRPSWCPVVTEPLEGEAVVFTKRLQTRLYCHILSQEQNSHAGVRVGGGSGKGVEISVTSGKSYKLPSCDCAVYMVYKQLSYNYPGTETSAVGWLSHTVQTGPAFYAEAKTYPAHYRSGSRVSV